MYFIEISEIKVKHQIQNSLFVNHFGVNNFFSKHKFEYVHAVYVADIELNKQRKG